MFHAATHLKLSCLPSTVDLSLASATALCCEVLLYHSNTGKLHFAVLKQYDTILWLICKFLKRADSKMQMISIYFLPLLCFSFIHIIEKYILNIKITFLSLSDIACWWANRARNVYRYYLAAKQTTPKLRKFCINHDKTKFIINIKLILKSHSGRLNSKKKSNTDILYSA